MPEAGYAFVRLKKLGDERWMFIQNELIRGIPTVALARTIQAEWGEFQDVAEMTLVQQLSRLRTHLRTKVLGDDKALEVAQAATPAKRLKALEDCTTVSALAEMEELLMLQKGRAQRLVEKEKAIPHFVIPGLSEILRDYSGFLKDYQKMRFETGMDQYHGAVSGIRGAVMTETDPKSGLIVQREVYESATTVDELLKRKGF
jgi:hypothetical protein